MKNSIRCSSRLLLSLTNFLVVVSVGSAAENSKLADGIAVYHYEWVPELLLIFFVIFILPLYLQGKIYTLPEFFELRYGRPR